MIIKSITLGNYRLYEGKNIIKFKQDDDKPIFLISGENGFGKTTFLHSLIWCLYGRLITEVEAEVRKDIANSGYNSFLRNNLNNNVRAKLDALDDSKKDAIKRRGYSSDNEELKRITTYYVAIEFEDVVIPSLPCTSLKVVRSYDMVTEKENVDIEQIVALAETNTSTEKRRLCSAYNEVLGVRKYEDLKKNLENVRLRFRKKSSDVASREKLVSMLNKQEELEKQVGNKRLDLSNLESELLQLRSEDEAIQLQLMREGNDATSAEIARIEKLIETTKQKDEEYKRQLRQFIDYAPFAITGKLFKETRDQIEYDFKLREAKNDQLSRNLVVSQITSDLMLMFEHSTISSPEKSELILQVQDVLEKYKHEVSDENVLLSVSEQDYEEFLSIYTNLTTTYKSEFEHLAEDYKKNKLVLERNSRRLSNIQSKEKDELIKSIRAKKNQIEKDIAQKDAEIRQMHESIGEMSQELATISRQVSELSKKVSLDDSDAKKDAVAEKLIEELSTFLVSLKQEKKYSLERRIKTTLNTLMHKEDFIGRVEVVIDGEDMDINLYSVDGKVINKDSLSKGEQQLYATSILKALVDESGIQFPVFIDSPLQKFDKSHATKIITEFYPQISKQVVLFPLLYKELTAEEYNVMKPLVKTTYLIKNDVTHSFFEEVPVNNFIKES